MEKITHYDILTAGSAQSLSSAVEQCIHAGWQPYGPMSHSVVWGQYPDGRPSGRVLNELYAQAIVRTEVPGGSRD